jgi:hypothetical protein
MAGLASQRLQVRPLARREAERHHSSSASTARGCTRLPKGCPASGSRPLTTKIRMTMTLQALGVKTPCKQPNSTTGVVSQRSRGGPLARRRKAERHYSFCLDRKRAHAASKGGGCCQGQHRQQGQFIRQRRLQRHKRWASKDGAEPKQPGQSGQQRAPGDKVPKGAHQEAPPPGPLTMTSRAAACSPS